MAAAGVAGWDDPAVDGGLPLDPDRARQIVTGSPDPIFVVTLDGRVEWANDAVSVLGWRPEEVVGRGAFDMLRPEDLQRAAATLLAVSRQDRPPVSTVPYDVRTGDGGWIECDVAGWLVGPAGAPEAIAVHVRPTRDARILRRVLERMLAGDDATVLVDELLDLLRHRADYARVLVWFVDEAGAARVAGDALDPRLGGADAADGSPWARARDDGVVALCREGVGLPDDIAALAVQAGLRDCLVAPVHAGDRHLATLTAWTIEGAPPAQLETYSVPLLRQLVELVLRWRRQARDLELAARRDPLTGLPNRRALDELALDADAPLGVLYVDLDGFKPVNDEHGHGTGDLVLQVVAARLAGAVRADDVVARMGGDEFGIVCPGADRAEVATLAARLIATVAEPIEVDGARVVVGCSIGAEVGPGSVAALLAAADHALYAAKDAGRGTLRWA